MIKHRTSPPKFPQSTPSQDRLWKWHFPWENANSFSLISINSSLLSPSWICDWIKRKTIDAYWDEVLGGWQKIFGGFWFAWLMRMNCFRFIKELTWRKIFEGVLEGGKLRFYCLHDHHERKKIFHPHPTPTNGGACGNSTEVVNELFSLPPSCHPNATLA